MRPGAKQSIRTKILIPVAFVLVLQALLFFGTIVGADTAGQLRETPFPCWPIKSAAAQLCWKTK